MRDLTLTEMHGTSGGVDVYPPQLYGYELVGWSEDIIGWDTTTWTEQKGVWTTIEHSQVTPIYSIQPIYEPIVFYMI